MEGFYDQQVPFVGPESVSLETLGTFAILKEEVECD